MPKRTYNIPGEEADYESNFAVYTGPAAKPNQVFRVKLDGAWMRDTAKGDRITVLVKVTDAPAKQKRYAGHPFWDGVTMSENSMWKWVEIAKALGVPFKQASTIVTNSKDVNQKLGEVVTKVGPIKLDGIECLVKTGMGKDQNGAAVVQISNWLPLPDDEDDDQGEAGEDDEDTEDTDEGDGEDEDGDPPF